MPQVRMPNGDIVNFPDDMPNEQIKGMIATKFPELSKPSFVGGVKDAYNERLGNIEGFQKFSKQGLQTQGETLLQQGGQVGAFGGDVMGEAVKSLGRGVSAITPDVIENPIKSGAEFVGKAALNTPQGKMALMALEMGKRGYDKLEEVSPRSARNLDAVANIGMALPGGYGAGVAGKGAVKKVANTLDSGVLPDELQTLNPLLKSGKPTVFSRTPKEAKLGIDANIGISKAYDTAKQLQSNAYDRAGQSGSFLIDGAGIDKSLSKIITDYKGQVAVGSGEQAAIKKLTDIQSGIRNKKSVTAKDLMDIETAINSGLSGTRFAKVGDTKLFGFKNDVKNALEAASSSNPQFAADYNMAKELGQDLASKFTGNESLKPFWRPKDYVSWKANQKMPTQALTNNEGLSRAGRFLEQLNTKELGKIRAVTDVLPKEQVEELMRAAVIKARQNDISFASAFNSLAHGNIGVAAAKVGKTIMGQGHGVPIDDTIKSLKGLRQKEVALKPNQALKDVELVLRDATPYPDTSQKKISADKAKRLGFTEEPPIYKASRQGVASKMTQADKEFAETARKKATETGLTPDVNRSQIVNQVNKAYEQRGLQRNAAKEAEIAKIAEKSSVSVEQLIDMSELNRKALASELGIEPNISNLGEALIKASKKGKTKKGE